MHCNTFGKSLVFAGLAAAGTLPWLALAGPLLGGHTALAAYLVGVTAIYLGGLAQGRRRRVAVLAATALLGGGVTLAARSLTELTLVLAVLLATARSGFLYRMPVARAVVTEAVLLGAGLVFARFLAGGSPGAIMLALWGFLLVQSLYFLVGNLHAATASGRHPDPFEEAYGRAVALLDNDG